MLHEDMVHRVTEHQMDTRLHPPTQQSHLKYICYHLRTRAKYICNHYFGLWESQCYQAYVDGYVSALQSMDDSGSTKTLFYTMEAPIQLPAPSDNFVYERQNGNNKSTIQQQHTPYFMCNLERMVEKTYWIAEHEHAMLVLQFKPLWSLDMMVRSK